MLLLILNREKYGEVSIRVDYAKKENRAKSADVMKLEEFLNTYNDSDQYLVDSLPEEMWGEFILPPCLLCGGFTSRLQARIFCSPICFYISFSMMIAMPMIEINVCTSQPLRKLL